MVALTSLSKALPILRRVQLSAVSRTTMWMITASSMVMSPGLPSLKGCFGTLPLMNMGPLGYAAHSVASLKLAT